MRKKIKKINSAPRSTLHAPRFSGFTLIEAMTLLFLFTVIVLTFYQVLTKGTGYMDYSKNRLGALAVANEKMEIARNLDYADVGATGEVASGNIPQDEDVTQNGHTYHVHTLVTYVDDPFDGKLGGSPNDMIPEDYKLVEITVSWNTGGANAGSVSLSSRFVPNGLEIADPNTGILSINVIGSDGSAVTGAAVHIVNSNVGINETLQTDASGNAMLVGAPAIQDYQIMVSKSGYETVATLPPYPTTPYNPTYPYQSVIAGSLNIANIIEDKTSNLTVSTTDQSGSPVPGVAFKLSGGRVLGTQAIPPFASVYDTDNVSNQTGTNGTKEYDAISPGQYTFSLSGPVSGYTLVGIEPTSPFPLAPGQSLSLNVGLASTSVTSALISVFDSVTNKALSGASVELSSASGYDKTVTTDSNGTAYFPVTAGDATFIAGNYTLKVSASSYQADTETVMVSNGTLLNKSVSLVGN
ncbi:MAG: carboxypeptidase regulatory-like domain-containing protein [Candidatus Pacebacteria bacterium]|nr:carboxypeptidase regulatory-like domain-containing protein [Candidatus Paceibacterota bacterium]MDR3582967.1 carboxypeptidase regulatory-like domain-containing protein [Candidatus Paceibacterota bacterium]